MVKDGRRSMHLKRTSFLSKQWGLPYCYLFFLMHILSHGQNPVELVYNTKDEIAACKDAVKLELVRTWGGSDEKDIQKSFSYPTGLAVDRKTGNISIGDGEYHCVKVFDEEGHYLRTIGRFGQGPGDLSVPGNLALSPDGDLFVYEDGTLRIQQFSPEGKSKKIIKIGQINGWLGVTSRKELAYHVMQKTYMTKSIIFILDESSNVVRTIGRFDDTSMRYHFYRFAIAMDDEDSFYAADTRFPVIKKYDASGALKMVIAYESPLWKKEIKLNPEKTDIEPLHTLETSGYREEKKGSSFAVSATVPKTVCHAIAVGPNGRIFVVMPFRDLTEKEIKGTSIMGTLFKKYRNFIDHDLAEEIDFFHLLIFNRNGKIEAAIKFKGLCDKIYVSGDSVFIIDGLINQRILEYKIIH